MSKYKNIPYLSYTGFSKYQDCPQQYYLEYIAKERPEVEDSRNSFTGSALHCLLEDYILNGEDNPSWLVKNAVPYWEKQIEESELIVWRHGSDKDELLQKMRKWSISLSSLIKEAKIKPSEWVPEFKADSDISLNGMKVRMGGRIDLMRRKENGDTIFFDLKGSENRSIMKLDQIVWYSVLLGVYLKDMSQPVAGGYLLPGFNEVKLFKVSEAMKVDLLNRLYSAFVGIKEENFEPKPESKRCWWCSVKHACPLYGGALEKKNGIIDLGSVI